MSTLEQEAVLFCQTLRALTADQPMQWRSVRTVARQASLRPRETQSAVRLARIRGWLECENGQSVALTDAGRRGCDQAEEALMRFRQNVRPARSTPDHTSSPRTPIES
jgi:CHASE3 domain sensor protein